MHTSAHRHLTASGGFTLVETMFAIVIMGIALAMIAGVIPVGLQLSQSSTGTVEAKVGSRNAVTFARSMLTRQDLISHSPVVGTQFVQIDVDSLLTTDIYLDDPGEYQETNLVHPLARKEDDSLVTDERKGFKLLARRMQADANSNDYLLAFFFYREDENFTPDNTDEDLNEMAMKKASIDSLAGDKRSIELSNSGLAKYFQPGSIVLGQNGSWARVSSITGATIRLDSALAGDKGDIEPVWTIYEHTGDTDNPLGTMSPGLGILTVRTALRNAQ